LGAMMGVSYRGERMIGNMPFSLFNGHQKKIGKKINFLKRFEKKEEKKINYCDFGLSLKILEA
jgi:hypothetical protein